MDCRTFRSHHVGFVDDNLPGLQIVEMQRHIAECASCARHDASIRRSLLVFRNLPAIQCSADFGERLSEKIRAVRAEPLAYARVGPSVARMATGLLAAAALAVAAVNLFDRRDFGPMTHPPVVASEPAPDDPLVEPSMMTSQAMLASMSAGIPIWPAAILMEEAPAQFANIAFHLATLER